MTKTTKNEMPDPVVLSETELDGVSGGIFIDMVKAATALTTVIADGGSNDPEPDKGDYLQYELKNTQVSS